MNTRYLKGKLSGFALFVHGLLQTVFFYHAFNAFFGIYETPCEQYIFLKIDFAQTTMHIYHANAKVAFLHLSTRCSLKITYTYHT